MPDSYSGYFFRHVRSTFLFICSTTSNLNNFEPQKHVQNEKKKQNRRPEPRNHTKDPSIAPLFSALCDFFETFWIAPKGPSFICFDILQHNGCQKNRKGSPLLHFRHCDTILILNFFGKFFQVPKGAPLQFSFHILQPAGVSQSPKGPPFYNFEP